MAKVEFTGWVEGQLTGDRGVWGLKTAEPHSKKTDTGWETVSRTFRDVKATRVDLSPFVKGSRVRVVGSERTEKFENRAGIVSYRLVVWADTVEGAPGRAQEPAGRPKTTGTYNSTGSDPWAVTGSSDGEPF